MCGLSKDITTDADDSLNNNYFELVFGLNHPKTSRIVYTDRTLKQTEVIPMSVPKSKEYVCVLVYAGIIYLMNR